MRLMLGKPNAPSLLVSVEGEFNPTKFDFFVVNGAWKGCFTNGHITTKGAPGGDATWLNAAEILCDNQDRLGGEYNEVFEHFSDPTYIAPKDTFVPPPEWDDDIPF